MVGSDGQPTSRSRANNGKYLMHLKKLISDQIRESVLGPISMS